MSRQNEDETSRPAQNKKQTSRRKFLTGAGFVGAAMVTPLPPRPCRRANGRRSKFPSLKKSCETLLPTPRGRTYSPSVPLSHWRVTVATTTQGDAFPRRRGREPHRSRRRRRARRGRSDFLHPNGGLFTHKDLNDDSIKDLAPITRVGSAVKSSLHSPDGVQKVMRTRHEPAGNQSTLLRYRLSQRRMKPSRPCGMKITMAMKIMPTGMR